MSFYDTLRHFADSWGLLALVLNFLAVLVWVSRPNARQIYRSQADIPFKYDDKGGDDAQTRQ
ncbi:cbb3-type cytochrome c oxidase subunit 3 [Aureimonas fodinaquatilis]|uniref:Cbb3-type cytochrome c oxidase subunit 3 n=1 Tax=Aureimonas fodinaquatilis TaxID=2565783 RepID=A0A5B0DYE0_9HYPH|nr:cbb3-type cytochrome c oxidase subunit 3 [Aureimonas fodinaquatilis]KAA0971804.1 cbb3-type cytochrome c oxidase subunit 3 [Aureimonas fodinaquatilis]